MQSTNDDELDDYLQFYEIPEYAITEDLVQDFILHIREGYLVPLELEYRLVFDGIDTDLLRTRIERKLI